MPAADRRRGNHIARPVREVELQEDHHRRGRGRGKRTQIPHRNPERPRQATRSLRAHQTPAEKSRSTRACRLRTMRPETLPALLTYFRQGKLDKFFLGASGSQPDRRTGLLVRRQNPEARRHQRTRQSIPREFYDLLDKNKAAFVTATTAEAEQGHAKHQGGAQRRLYFETAQGKDIRRCQQFTEDDEEFIEQSHPACGMTVSLPNATPRKSPKP